MNTNKFKIILRIFSFVLILTSSLLICNEEFDKNENYFSNEILEKYAEYVLLEDSKNTCNYEKIINSMEEEKIKEKIIENSAENTKNCVPDYKSLIAILENGWENLTEFLIKEIYFPKLIDPSQTVLSFINKSESKLKSLSQFINEYINSNNLIPKYTFENLDDRIKFNIVLPDASFNPEYISLFCYKDSFKINSVLKSKNRIFLLKENKQFYDQTSGGCEHTYNSFNNQIELSFNKLNKLKKWDKLFK